MDEEKKKEIENKSIISSIAVKLLVEKL